MNKLLLILLLLLLPVGAGAEWFLPNCTDFTGICYSIKDLNKRNKCIDDWQFVWDQAKGTRNDISEYIVFAPQLKLFQLDLKETLRFTGQNAAKDAKEQFERIRKLGYVGDIYIFKAQMVNDGRISHTLDPSVADKSYSPSLREHRYYTVDLPEEKLPASARTREWYEVKHFDLADKGYREDERKKRKDQLDNCYKAQKNYREEFAKSTSYAYALEWYLDKCQHFAKRLQEPIDIPSDMRTRNLNRLLAEGWELQEPYRGDEWVWLRRKVK